MVVRAGWIGLAALAGVGCGPSYGVTFTAALGPEIWDRVGNEPAFLFERTDGQDLVRAIAAPCPGDDSLETGSNYVFWGCQTELHVEVWLAPDSEVPVPDDATALAPAPEDDVGCDRDRPLPVFQDPEFDAEGWPSDRLVQFEGDDGDVRMLGHCSGWTAFPIALE